MQCEYWRELNALIDFGFWFMGFGWLGGVKAWDMGVGYSFFLFMTGTTIISMQFR